MEHCTHTDCQRPACLRLLVMETGDCAPIRPVGAFCPWHIPALVLLEEGETKLWVPIGEPERAAA